MNDYTFLSTAGVLASCVFAVVICLNLSPFLGYFRIAKRDRTERLIFLLEIIYGSFVVFSTLCLVRLTSILPQVLSNRNPQFDPTINSNIQADFPNIGNIIDMKIYALFGEYFLSSFSMLCIAAFILSRLILNSINGNREINKAILRAKKVWGNTLVSWAAIFTVISTISLLISAQ